MTRWCGDESAGEKIHGESLGKVGACGRKFSSYVLTCPMESCLSLLFLFYPAASETAVFVGITSYLPVRFDGDLETYPNAGDE